MSQDHTHVAKSYAATSIDEQQAAYDDWAEKYEADLCAFGNRIPAVVPTVFASFVELGTAPILDAGCGGGIQAEPLALMGYGPITGIDLSDGMLGVARSKGFYAELRQMTLGEHLDFPDDHPLIIFDGHCVLCSRWAQFVIRHDRGGEGERPQDSPCNPFAHSHAPCLRPRPPV